MKTINIHGVEMPVSYINDDGHELRLVIYPDKETNRLKCIYACGKPIDNQLITFSNIFTPEKLLKKELESCKNALISRGLIK